MSGDKMLTRRTLLRQSAFGFGSLALGHLLVQDGLAGHVATPPDLSCRPGHFPAVAKSVIMLFQNGGPSHMDLFDPKPELNRRHGEKVDIKNAMQGNVEPLLGSKFKFQRRGRSGIEFSEIVPHLGALADDLCVVRSMFHEDPNHPGGTYMLCSCNRRPGRPSLGAWVVYGLGSESTDLPGFVVLQSGPRGPRGGAVLWGSGMLPSAYQGVPLRNRGEPILNLSSPEGVTSARQRGIVDAVGRLNRQRLAVTGDGEIATRIAAYEMAFRMQSSAPDLVDLRSESAETLALYGIADPGESTYARNCLLARRLVERGVRYVQLWHTNWDHHGGPSENLETHLPEVCGQVDRASAGLVLDLARRGLLDDTIVVWGGEFGRTPMGEKRESTGRNHHIDAFTMWFAGGGFKPGCVHGTTDDFGFAAVDGGVHVRDIHATLLHLLGIDHQRLAVRFQGLDERLTGVKPARVIGEILA